MATLIKCYAVLVFILHLTFLRAVSYISLSSNSIYLNNEMRRQSIVRNDLNSFDELNSSKTSFPSWLDGRLSETEHTMEYTTSVAHLKRLMRRRIVVSN